MSTHDAMAHYVHVHLAGAAAGIDLFGRGASSQADPQVRDLLETIQAELRQERSDLLRMAHDLGVGESTLLNLTARVGERIGRLKPNDSWLRRTPLTDLVELEMMHDAVSGKVAGWRALLTAVERHPALDADELEALLEQGLRQLDQLRDAHHMAAARALG